MTTAAISDPSTHKTQRAALQAKLKSRDTLKANLDRAHRELEMGQELVRTFQRTQGYLTAFETAFARAAQEYNDLDNVIPNELRNSCRDRDLKDQFEVAISIRSGLIQDRQAAREVVKRAVQDHESLKTRISLQRGTPAIAKAGESLPWERGVIAKAFTALQIAIGQVEVATWAISDDGQEIAFAPGAIASDVEFYSEQWFESLRAMRMATAADVAAEKRLEEAEATLAEVKNRLVWSPV